MKKIFASHNSFTFLKPEKWYMSPFNFISKCQSKTIEEQYSNYNVRIYDLRIWFDKHGQPKIKHGLMTYKSDSLLLLLRWLNNKARRSKIYVRVILEVPRHIPSQETLFCDFCNRIKKEFKYITFTEGRRKYDWEQVYCLSDTPYMDADFSSVKGTRLNDLWPWLYAKLHNKKAIKNSKEKYLMLDFVNIN